MRDGLSFPITFSFRATFLILKSTLISQSSLKTRNLCSVVQNSYWISGFNVNRLDRSVFIGHMLNYFLYWAVAVGQ